MPGPVSATVSSAAPFCCSALTVTVVPSGVWRRALSSRIRMIWATRSRSQRAETAPSGSFSSSFVRCWATAGRNSAATVVASSPISTSSGFSSSEPASRRDRSSRSTDSFWRRSTCSRIARRNSSRVSGSSCSSWSSSTNPPSEKIGVRSSCEAFAMNSLRARSTCASCTCISLKACVRRPSSSCDSTGMGCTWRPAARSSAARSSRETRLAIARATKKPLITAITSATPLASRSRSRTSRTNSPASLRRE